MSSEHTGSIRFFSPSEMLHFFGFPDSFTFPDSMRTNNRYKVVGQSVNVIVVRSLMHSVLCSFQKAKSSLPDATQESEEICLRKKQKIN